MARHYGIGCALAVALALALPAPGAAQAVARGSATSGSSSGSSSSSSSGESTSRGGGVSSPERSAPTRVPSAGAVHSGSARSRSTPAPPPPGGRTGAGVSSGSSRVGGVSTGSATAGSPASYGGVRSRAGRPAIGTAVNRPDAGFVSFPLFGPWGRWYPWYTSGFGGLGFVTYNPWRYGATRWVWGRYGLWYDPYAYYPYGYGPYSGYGYGPYYAGGGASIGEPETGSIRLRVKPATAKVYIDGALAGIVDEFDGLTSHLDLSPGVHQIELRADGYESYVGQITVEAGKTRTERLSLKKK